MNDYAIVVFWSDEDERWVADVPDLWPCSALGDSPEEAVKEVRVAIAGVLAVIQEGGGSVPLPRFRPESLRLVS